MYSKYKESTIEWIGIIPDDWKKSKLKYYSNVITGSTPSTSNQEYFNGEVGTPWVKPSDLAEFNSVSTSKQYLTEKGLIEARVVRKGSILIGGIGEIGKLGVAGCTITTNQQIHAIEGRSDKIVDNFLKYLIYTSIDELKRNSSSVVLSILTKTKLLDLDIIIPSLKEQTKIAQYLDHQTAIIDQLIQQKERLIVLLKEKRQAVINEAVTKGLNPSVKMKDSGIEWLGVVPEHWEVTKLKFLAKLNPSKSEIENSITGEDVVSFLPMEKVEENWSYDKNCTAKYSEVSAGLTYFKEGDIIMAKITPCFENGKAAILESLVNGFGFGSTEFHTIRPFKIERRYLFYVTRSDYFMSNGESFMTGSAGQKRVPTSFVSDFFVPIPKPTEQIEIALYIENHIEKNNKISNELELQIEKLKEYRQSIISEAVTGKIDVRDWQPNKKQVS